MNKPTLPFKLPAPALEDLATILDHKGVLASIADPTDELRNAVTISEMIVAVSRCTSLDQVAAEKLSRAIWGFAAVKDTLDLSAPDFIERLVNSATSEANGEWSIQYAVRLQEARELLTSILETNAPFHLLSKTNRLAVLHQNIWQSCIIVTDIRPVFSNSGDELLRAAVTHMMVIDYTSHSISGALPQRMFIRLDAQDLDQIISQCERAKTKSATVKKAFICPISVIGTGD